MKQKVIDAVKAEVCNDFVKTFTGDPIAKELEKVFES